MGAAKKNNLSLETRLFIGGETPISLPRQHALPPLQGGRPPPPPPGGRAEVAHPGSNASGSAGSAGSAGRPPDPEAQTGHGGGGRGAVQSGVHIGIHFEKKLSEHQSTIYTKSVEGEISFPILPIKRDCHWYTLSTPGTTINTIYTV